MLLLLAQASSVLLMQTNAGHRIKVIALQSVADASAVEDKSREEDESRDGVLPAKRRGNTSMMQAELLFSAASSMGSVCFHNFFKHC